MLQINFYDLVHSSEIIWELLYNTAAIPFFFLMFHIAFALLWMSNGSLNAECVVRPPSNKVAAMPDDAIANAIFCCDFAIRKD